MAVLASYPRLRRALRIAAAVCGALVILLFGLFGLLQTDWARDEIRQRIAAETAGSGAEIAIEAIDGTIPFDVALRGVRIADTKGVWLEIDRVALRWSPGALLSGRLRIDDLTADLVRVARAPAAVPDESDAPAEFALPELPVDIDLRQARIIRLDLAAPILGVPASLTATAEARLGRLGEMARAKLTLRTIEGPAGSAALDLSYRPEEDLLELSGDVQEPQGGLVGRLLGLPRGSSLRIALDGSGPLSAWRGTALAELDGAKILDLQGEVSGTAPRRVAFTLEAMPPAALLPPESRPLLEGGIHAEGTLRFDRDADLLRVERLHAAAAAGRIDAVGAIGQDETDLALAIEANDPRPFAALLPGIAWSGARIDGTLRGSPARPQLAAQAALRDLAAGEARAGSLTLDLAADATQGFGSPIALEAAVALSGIVPRDARLAPLVAGDVRLAFAGSATRAGAIVVETLDVTGGGIELSASGSAAAWGAAELVATGALAIADIAVLNDLTRLQAQGGLDLAFRVDPAQQGSRIEAMGAGSDLAFGIAQLDSLLGAAPQVSLSLEMARPLRLTIEQAEVAGAALSAIASGTIGEAALDLKLAATIDDLAVLEPSMSGRIALDGALTGSMNAPDLALNAAAPRLGVAGRTAQDVTLHAAVQNLLAPVIKAEANARLENLPARAAVSATVRDEAINAPSVTLRLGRTSLSGALTLAGGTITGRLALAAPDLAELQALAGTELRGSLTGDIALSAPGGRQGARVDATATQLALADQFTAGHTTLSAQASDLFGTPALEATSEFAEVTLAGQALDMLRLSAAGPLTELRTKLDARGGDRALNAAAVIARRDEETRVTLNSLEGTFKDVTLRSLQQAGILVAPGLVQVENLALSVEGGALRLEGALQDETLDATLRIEQAPVALIRIVAPGLPLTGQLDGTVRLTGPVAAPAGNFELAATRLTAPGLAGRQGDLAVKGTLADGRLDLTGALALGDQGRLDLAAATSSLSADATLRGTAAGSLDLALLDAFLAGGADRAKGQASLDVTLGGTLAAPAITGAAALQGVEYDNLRYGIKLRQIAAQLRFDGRRIEIADLAARAPGDGRISGQGSIDLGGGVALDLALHMSRLRAVDTELASAIIDGDLALRGNLAERLGLSGAIHVREAEIRVPDSLPPGIQEIQVVEVNASPARQAELAAQEQTPQHAFDLDLDVTVDAPRRIFVRGRGLDAELGGALRIAGTADLPDIEGALDLRRGSLDIVGKRLDFTAGKITFEGGAEINPLLDFTATTRSDNLTVTATVEGSARAPRITLSSAPPLPQDEILARLLFGKSVGALSPFELLQLAQATAELAGISTGPGILDRIREGTGLDRLTLEQAEGAAGPSLGAGRYVADGVYVGVRQGAQANTGAATVEIEVTPNIKLESELGASGSGKTGVNLEWDY